MKKLSINDAIHHQRDGVDGFYYQLPLIQNGTTIVQAEFTGEHGERTIGERERIYFILEGKGECIINNEKIPMQPGDLIVIPSYATYNLWPTEGVLKVLLYMELISFE